MQHITDLAALIVILFSFWHGWDKGLIDLLLGPLSCLTALGGGLWFYDFSHNLIWSLAVGIIGPILLHIIIWSLQQILGSKNKKNDEKETKILSISSMLAGILNSIWGTSLFLGLLTAIILLPLKNHYVQDAQKNIKSSQTFALMQKFSNKKFPDKPIAEEKIKEWMKPINTDKWSKVEKIDKNKK